MIHPEHKRTGNVLSNIGAYIAAKEAITQAPGRLIAGEMMVQLNGQWVDMATFKSMMPNPESLLIKSNFKGENCCKKVGNIS